MDRPSSAGRPSRRTSSAGNPGDQPESGRSAAGGPRAISRRQGGVNVLVPPPPPPLEGVASCLARLRSEWRREGNLAALWQSWATLAGPQLAAHCRPLRLQGGCLSVGAAPGPWLQALQYNRHQLLGALRAGGFAVRELRIEQHHAPVLPPPASSAAEQAWQHHPSRVDLHGMGQCPRCGSPAPAGEIKLWGHCSFCRRANLAPGADRAPGAGSAQ